MLLSKFINENKDTGYQKLTTFYIALIQENWHYLLHYLLLQARLKLSSVYPFSARKKIHSDNRFQ